jgi:hypothetical protein
LALADEALTLAAAAQFAGFDHVIDSLYVLDDLTALEIVRRFYNPFVAGGENEPMSLTACTRRRGRRAIDSQAHTP